MKPSLSLVGGKTLKSGGEADERFSQEDIGHVSSHLLARAGEETGDL